MRGATWLAAALLVLIGARGDVIAVQQTAPPVFSWKSRYDEALAVAREHELLVAVYFRPVVGAEPSFVRHAAKTKNLGRLVSGVKVGATEVLELRERFGVARFPALVVLDARETVLGLWQENVPSDVWTRVARTFLKEEERHAKDAKEVEAARELVDSGRPGLAFKKLRPLLRSRRTAARVLQAARDVETRLVEDGERRILLVLAAEGLVPDDRIEQRLRGLLAGPMPRRLEEARDRELRRLETTTIGGRRGD